MANKFQEIERKVQAEAEESFIDSRFGKLADKYTTNFQDAPDESWIDPRFSSGPAEITNPLRDQVVAFANSGDPDAERILAEAGVRDQSVKSSFRTKDWEGECHWSASDRKWIFDVQNLETQEVRTLFVSGQPENPDGAKVAAARELSEYGKTAGIRILTPTQELHVLRLASKHGGMGEAFAALMAYAFADLAEDDPTFDPTTRPELQDYLEQWAWRIWLNSTDGLRFDNRDLKEFKTFAKEYSGDRPLNCSLIAAAYNAFKNSNIVSNLQALDAKTQQPEPVTAADLDAMSDDQVDEAFDSVSRAYIKATRHRR